ncbi:MAG: diguanylate cyclase [Pseudomonadota bacterium]|nr:diguanylate cyclase [Pseudomonadota bacterium]
MNDHDMEQDVAEARETLALLNDKADGLRAELSILRKVQRGLGDMRGTHLVDVNEQLVFAALRADSLAETAVSDLQELARASQRDALTDTPNRALMIDRLEIAIANAQRHETRVAVFFIDIDNFKQINDTLGHAVGDEVLKLVARALEAMVRHADTVSRHSGDEFVVLLSEISQASDAALIAEKMLAALAAPSRVGTHALRMSASLGIAIYPEDGETAQTLIGHADAAMYRSKRNAPGHFEFYGDEVVSDRSAASKVVMLHQSAKGAEFTLAHDPRLRNLRDANEQLVMAALTAQETEERAGAAHRRQIAFLATVAHELRNPLTPILQAAELLHRPRTDNPRLARLQGVIKSQVAHMARLIDDLLDGSRISTGKFRLERCTVDVAGILRMAVETCQPAMDKRLQNFRMELPSGPLKMHGDPVRMVQVFSNLLDNASKYTQQGGDITLAVAAHGQTMRITLTDNGIGITPAALPHIFDLFVQDPHAVAVHSGGLGIGLAVVRELVEAHGGTVVARSTGARLGSQFIVTLPITDHPGAPGAV